MTHIRHNRWAVALALIFSAPCAMRAQTQSSVQPVPAALPSDSLCTYDRCTLWLSPRGLVQGAEARPLARESWLRPLPLRRFVSGDSAVFHATRYEHERRLGAKLSLLSGLTTVAGMVILLVNDCWPGADRCNISDGGAVAALTLIFGSIAIDVAGERHHGRATQARARALWWHNRQFAR